MASHGGIIGVMIAATYFGMRNKLPALHLIDLATLGGCIGIFFGRIANFINGELLGRVAETPIFFAVKFPQEILAWPSQAPGKLSALGAVVERLGVSSSTWQTWLSQPALYYTSIENTLYQIISRIQDGDAALKISLAPFLSARYPSQLYEAILEGLFVLVVLVWVWRKPQKPGVIAATFGITYSLVRIVGEAYRLPDAHIGYQMFGLTRGQILSAVMALGMTTLLLYALKKPGTKIGGWLNGRTKNIN
jgi:phosphatidylglycerol:prolipoprotein diacylglycerol transferase